LEKTKNHYPERPYRWDIKNELLFQEEIKYFLLNSSGRIRRDEDKKALE